MSGVGIQELASIRLTASACIVLLLPSLVCLIPWFA
ncbi:hypothetical protein A2U01_0025100, partial [Trifolium medium]|nr:hypothetical protein [Trifolium medium]